jgi:hypothetical protein
VGAHPRPSHSFLLVGMEGERVSWLKLDDGFPEHPKIADLSDAAFRAHLSAICYAARALTDGWVPESFAKVWPRKTVRELEAAGLWTRADVRGYLIHDYLDWQPAKAAVLERRRKESERKQGGIRKESERKDERNPKRKEPGIRSPDLDLDLDTETPTSTGSSNPGKPGEEAKELAAYLKQRLQARGVTEFSRDWHLKAAAVTQTMLRRNGYGVIYGCINWLLDHEFWATKVDRMEVVRDHLGEYQQLANGVVGKPNVARLGVLDRLAYQTREEERRGQASGGESGPTTGRSLPG